ncbi:hypothetical protein L226DRAFT_574520 [Lentinus tigrinus ALCF2SS1-7]|uniref:uncharacterized protein n=1 Tax=Lentinus tigrinus ALCF2SS1-7 TaxID=1328758 RepID=UPI001165FCE0|nr:hypothetical protein L226DRAFT_574520 [Lentinus tigrinus ALCF2SS1-7]
MVVSSPTWCLRLILQADAGRPRLKHDFDDPCHDFDDLRDDLEDSSPDLKDSSYDTEGSSDDAEGSSDDAEGSSDDGRAVGNIWVYPVPCTLLPASFQLTNLDTKPSDMNFAASQVDALARYSHE